MPDPKNMIPHREPFLLLDKILEVDEEKILAETTLREEDDLWSRVYGGHYPGNPITPGVLLCEMVFQAAACLVSHRLQDTEGTPVLTRIGSAKFKQMVRPGDTVEIAAAFKEQLSNAFYMTGTVKVEGKLAVRIEYTVAIVAAE